MAQRIAFPLLPKVEDAFYLDKLNRLLFFIDEQRPSQREVREFMQEQEMWDREVVTDDFWEFYGIVKEKRFKLGKLGSRLLDSRRNLDEEKEILFRHVLRENEVLAKYVFDALAERLHSDAELYRYLTSYVYPGKKLRRPDFLAYLKLLSVIGYIRIIGIRWALADPGKDAMKTIEQIDVESILEEERMEETEDEDADEHEHEKPPQDRHGRRQSAARRDEQEDEDEHEQEDEDEHEHEHEHGRGRDAGPSRREAPSDARPQGDGGRASKAGKTVPPAAPRPRARPADEEEDEEEGLDMPPSAAPRPAPEDEEDDAPAARRPPATAPRQDEEPERRAAAAAAPPPAVSRRVTEPARATPPGPGADAAQQERAPAAPAPGKAIAPALAPARAEPEPAMAVPAAELLPEPRRRTISVALGRPFGQAQVAENVERLRRWWEDHEHRQLRRATDFGMSPLEYELAPQPFLLKMLSLATLIVGDPRRADRWSFVNQLDRVRFFPRLMAEPATLYSLLAELRFLDGEAGHRLLAENLLTMLRHREALAGQPELVARLAEQTDGEELVRLLRETFFDGLPLAEPHWVLREMVLLGLWKAPALRRAAAVPQRPARQMAYRLGLLETPYAAAAGDLLEASRRIAEALGPETSFDEPLGHLAAALGCRPSCPAVESCSYHCRECYDL